MFSKILPSKAQKSSSKAKKPSDAHDAGSSQPKAMSGHIHRLLYPPVAFAVTPVIAEAIQQGTLESDTAHQSHAQGSTSARVQTGTPTLVAKVTQTQHKIFQQNVVPPVAKYSLPEEHGRITSTPQLAYCLSLLSSSLISKDGLDENEKDWSQAKANYPDEELRLQAMATDLIRAFVRDELKKPDVVAEVVSLATVLEQDDFRKLLQILADGIKESILLKVHLLNGLAHLIRNARHGYVEADDLVKILEILSMCLKHTHIQNSGHTYQLVAAVSCVLDGMVDIQVQGINRVELHEPLSAYLKGLLECNDPYLVYYAAYAQQALQYIPDDESILQTMLRRTGNVVQGISGVVTGVKALNLVGFIDGLQKIQGDLTGVKEAGFLVNDAYLNAKKLTENGQGLLESLKESFSSTRKSAWYPALRGLDELISEGRFAEFEDLARGAPCQTDPAFQWGMCQRLGEIAISTIWDTNTRKCAVGFLGELYKDDATWGQQVHIKQWILGILNQLADSSAGDTASQAHLLLQELKTFGSVEKQALLQAYKKSHPGLYPLTIYLPPKEYQLLDCIQNKPDIETPLRQLKRERLRDQGGDVYISPRAKTSPRATIDFDLTSKVQEFLDSNRKVFLVLGDSGVGKTTFNRALEISLWNKYDKVNGQIPLFIHLPSIEKPEYDLIDKHLRRVNFTEIQIRELKRYHRFVVICDGYDESQQTRNLYMSNQLNQAGGWQAQMVISCRTEYNGIEYKDCFQPTDQSSRGIPSLFQEAIIAPFNKDQIKDYVNQFVALRKPPWGSDEYQQAFRQVSNLQDLVRNPFLLKLALEVLPRLLESSSEFSRAHITRVGLYDEFVAQWIERSKKRLGEIELSSRDKDALARLLGFGFKQNTITYLKELAVAIYDNQGGNPVLNFSNFRDRRTWKEVFFDEMDGKHLLREAIPLTRDGDQFRFIHASVLEYGLSLAIFDPYDEKAKMASPTSSHHGSTNSLLSFEILPSAQKTAATIERTLLDSPLGRRSFVGQSSILQFLTERVQQHPILKDQMLAVIERSKTDEKARTGAGNAITIVAKAGIQFNGADLRGVKIPGADLSYGVFDSARFEGADLRKVNLCNTWMRQAKLSGTRMKGVRFGELPFLQFKNTVWCSAYSPDGTTYAVGLDNGFIGLYDTSSWKKTQSLEGHTSGVTSLQFSSTGDRIASGSRDDTVRLWNVDTGDCIHTFQGHSYAVTSVAYSLKGDRIASGSWDTTVRVWDVDSGDCIHTLQGHLDSIVVVLFSPDGSQVASGSQDETIRLWGADSGGCAHILQGHTSFVNCIVYSTEGNRIASGSKDGTVRLWDVKTGDCVHILQGCKGYVTHVIYSPRRDQIAAGSDDSIIRLWDVNTGECVYNLQGHSGSITSLTYSPLGDHIASGSWDKTVRLWDVDTGECVQTLQGHKAQVTSVVYSPKKHQIASGSLDMSVRLWDIGADCVQPIQGHIDAVTMVACSPTGNRIASGGIDFAVRLWNTDNSNCLHTLRGHSDLINCIVYSPNGDQVASGSNDKTVKLWDVDSGDCVLTLLGHDLKVVSVAYSPTRKQIASGGDDKTVRLWNLDTGDCLRTIQGHDDTVKIIVYSPNGNQIASGGEDRTVRLWDVDTGGCVHILQGHTNYILSVVFSPKGDLIASASFEDSVRLWDTDTGHCVHILKSYSSNTTTVVYSPQKNQVACRGDSSTIELWDTETGECVHALRGHGHNVSSIAYSCQGDQIASGSLDNTVRLWSVDSGECLVIISSFGGSVNCVAWENSPDGPYLVTGSSDKSVRRWQFAQEADGHKAVLTWSSPHEGLEVSDASFDDVNGLADSERLLLKQRGALIETS